MSKMAKLNKAQHRLLFVVAKIVMAFVFCAFAVANVYRYEADRISIALFAGLWSLAWQIVMDARRTLAEINSDVAEAMSDSEASR
jgi:hypothetical protein